MQIGKMSAPGSKKNLKLRLLFAHLLLVADADAATVTAAIIASD